MKIKKVYEKYAVPPNLQEHMIRVAKVASFICGHWSGEKIDKEKIIATSLTHDLGNIVRFDFNNPKFNFVDNKDVEYWKNKQDEVIRKYGKVDDEVTVKILNEIGVNKDIIDTIKEKAFIYSKKIANSNHWELKILLYSDLRVLPNSIGSLSFRLKEVKERRKDLSKRSDFDQLCEAAQNIEKQIENNIDISVEEITEKNLE